MPNNKTVVPRILILEGLWSDTAECVRAAGGRPDEEHPWDYWSVEEALLSGSYDGMILTGGSDINPNLYGEKPHPQCYGIDNTRDTVELMALRHAREMKLPVLGICRGSQIMCASQGGSLTQHIPGHSSTQHYVQAASDARTFKRAINSTSMPVVSLHHQHVRRPGRGMRIAAFAMDGTPEAIESKDGRMLGVQFHPELAAFENHHAFGIFRWLVTSAAQRAGGRAPHRRFRDARKAKLVDKYTSTGDVYGYDGWAWDNKYTGGAPTPATRRTALLTQTAESTLPERHSRKAGEPAIPSMRTSAPKEGVTESGKDSFGTLTPGYSATPYEPLSVCSHCGMIFDDPADRSDHMYYLHGIETPVFASAAERFPELEPPAGHPDWEDAEAIEVPFGRDDFEEYLNDPQGWLTRNGFSPNVTILDVIDAGHRVVVDKDVLNDAAEQWLADNGYPAPVVEE